MRWVRGINGPKRFFHFLEDLRISTGALSRARRNQRVVVLVVGVMDHGTMTGIDFHVEELNAWSVRGSVQGTDVLLRSRVKSVGTSKLPLCMLVHSFIFHVVFFLSLFFTYHDVGMCFISTLYNWRCTVLLVCMHGGNERMNE